MARTNVASSSVFSDIRTSVTAWRLWVLMGLQDVRQRYRGSLLGPIWLAGGLIAVSLGVGFLYANLFDQPIREFIPFVTAGLAAFTYVSLCVTEGCTAFINAGGLMKNTSLPIFLHVLRVVARNTIVFAHNLVVIVLILIVFQVPPTPYLPLVIPGLLLIAANLVWMTYVAALLSARYRDVAQIIIYLMQFALFVTPLFWRAEMITGPRRAIVDVNPFYHMVNVFRAPLLGEAPTATNWAYLLGMLVVGSGVAFLCHARFRRLIVFWV